MKRLAIFAGYDKDEIIDDYVIYYLKELKKVADIIFVYDTKYSTKELKKVKNLTVHQICEKHGEYDFGSYKRGYQCAKKQKLLSKYDNLIFVNDSIYGPFKPLKQYFEKMDNLKCDFWGMFKQGKYIQSYFAVFSKKVFNSKTFDKFILSVKKEKDKSVIISKYEYGLSKTLHKEGFKSKGLFKGYANDPHNYKAMKLVAKGFPFIKRSLFNSNEVFADCKDIYKYKNIIKNTGSKYPVKLIEKHINRVFGKNTLNELNVKRFSKYEFNFLASKIFKLRGRYLPNLKYKFSIGILGINVFKIKIPKSIAIKSK